MVIAILVTALGVMFASKWAADTESKRVSLKRLRSTGELCTSAAYPLTSTVLTQIQDLSGLSVAIFSEANDSDTFVLRSSSNRFPRSISPETIFSLCDQARTEAGRIASKSTSVEDASRLEHVATPTEGNYNAISILIPESNPSNRFRYLVLLENAADSRPTLVQAFVLPLATGIFASLAIALIAAIVANRIGSRIESLNSHVRSIADGSFRLETPQGPVDAIHSLHQSVNSMSLQLERSTGQIAKSERTRLINLMASGLSHELRNRLTGARLAIQTCQSNGDFSEGLAIAFTQMQLAEETVQRLLTISTSKTEHSEPSLSASQILDSVVQLTRPIALHQRAEFEVAALASDKFNLNAVTIGRGASVASALINLVLNAIEAAGPGGKVQVSVEKVQRGEKAMLQWVVVDNGKGPDLAVADAMFEPFFTTKREGVGLGLAMSKQVAEGQHGTVTWERRQGITRFIMEIQPIFWE